jgi:DNA polymerase (family 10)
MANPTNANVAKLLEDIADLLEVKGESVFRVRAYRDAARSIESLPDDIGDMVESGANLCDIPGVGESIASKIREYLQTGHLGYLDDLAAEISPGLAEMLSVPGLGPKKAQLFHEALGIGSVAELEEAARDHRLSTLPKIGAKTEENILDAIERLRARPGRTPLGIALPGALPFLQAVMNLKEVRDASLAGSLRRMAETIGDLDLLASSDEPEKVIDAFTELPMVKSVLGHGPTKGTIVTRDNLQVDLRVIKPNEWGAGLQYFTGSKSHNIHLRSIAEAMGLKVNEYGIFRVSDNERIAGETEESMYQSLGLEMMPPELREDRGEFEAAREGELPQLVQRSDIRGDLHVHTDWSDAADTPEVMVKAAFDLGYEYIAISDHSVSMGFVHGLTVDRIREQRALIDDLNRRHPGIHVFQGIEVNIRGDGTLDYDDDVLSRFDVVTASIHSGMGMPMDRMTERIVKAIRNPHVDVLGHPTGRLIESREPYQVDLEAVFRAAAETGTAMEINAQPDRLDLKDTDARRARDLGVMLVINSDAHSADQYNVMEYGVATARRGWVEPWNLINTMSLNDLTRWLQDRHVSRRAA